MSDTSRKCKVLYVEDNRADQRILREAIQFAGVAVELIAVSSAAAALEALANDSFQVLVVDWRLPAVTGFEFLSEVRSQEPHVPLIIVTGEPRVVDVKAAARLGVIRILTKPLLLEEWEQFARDVFDLCGTEAAAAGSPG